MLAFLKVQMHILKYLNTTKSICAPIVYFLINKTHFDNNLKFWNVFKMLHIIDSGSSLNKYLLHSLLHCIDINDYWYIDLYISIDIAFQRKMEEMWLLRCFYQAKTISRRQEQLSQIALHWILLESRRNNWNIKDSNCKFFSVNCSFSMAITFY